MDHETEDALKCFERAIGLLHRHRLGVMGEPILSDHATRDYLEGLAREKATGHLAHLRETISDQLRMLERQRERIAELEREVFTVGNITVQEAIAAIRAPAEWDEPAPWYPPTDPNDGFGPWVEIKLGTKPDLPDDAVVQVLWVWERSNQRWSRAPNDVGVWAWSVVVAYREKLPPAPAEDTPKHGRTYTQHGPSEAFKAEPFLNYKSQTIEEYATEEIGALKARVAALEKVIDAP